MVDFDKLQICDINPKTVTNITKIYIANKPTNERKQNPKNIELIQRKSGRRKRKKRTKIMWTNRKHIARWQIETQPYQNHTKCKWPKLPLKDKLPG